MRGFVTAHTHTYYTRTRAAHTHITPAMLNPHRTAAYGFLSPLLVNALLTFVSSPNVPLYWGLFLALGLAASTAIQTICVHRFYYRSLRLGTSFCVWL